VGRWPKEFRPDPAGRRAKSWVVGNPSLTRLGKSCPLSTQYQRKRPWSNFPEAGFGEFASKLPS
jgi:hypothetical protein